MTTALGGSTGAVLKMMVRNAAATTIPKGTVVSFSSVAASNPAAGFLDGTRNKDYGSGTVQQIDIPYINVIHAIGDGVTPGAVSRLGVAAADILPGKFGEIITYGLAQVLFAAAVTVGVVLTTAGAGLAAAAATASHKNPFGLALEAGGTNVLGWCFVNCLTSAGATAAGYMGKAY